MNLDPAPTGIRLAYAESHVVTVVTPRRDACRVALSSARERCEQNDENGKRGSVWLHFAQLDLDAAPIKICLT